jgi:NAD(P)-dependent dehydrogenase (short-subunit alcohol dehydrogenase family)
VSGATILVTGATGGIGLETARSLAWKGAQVVIGARDPARGRAVVDEITRAGGKAELLTIDLASFSSVREAALRFAAAHASLDVLVNNAGIAARPRQVSGDGHELTWQTNFLSAFLLTRLLLDKLRAARGPRVVNVSSDAHRVGRLDWDDLEMSHGRYRGFRAYANSKLALVLFTRELARREPRIAANALHPGTIATGIWRASPRPMQWILRLVLPSAEIGARPVVRLACAPELDGVSGRYFDRMREVEPAARARSDADAARLWDAAVSATR